MIVCPNQKSVKSINSISDLGVNDCGEGGEAQGRGALNQSERKVQL